MSLSGLGTDRRQFRMPWVELVSVGLLLVAVVLLGLELVGFSQQRDSLRADITVAGIPVGGLSTVEAQARWESIYAQPVQLMYNESPIMLDPTAVGFRTNSDVMLAQALSAGEDQASFWLQFWNYLWRRPVEPVNIPLISEYQQSAVRQYLEDIALRYDSPPGEPIPDLETLTFRSGTAGYVLDVEAAIPLVEQALLDPNSRYVNLPIVERDPSQSGGINLLRDMIIAFLDSEGFIYDGQTTVASVYILDLTTGEEVNLNGDVAYSAASTVKLPILMSYYRYLNFAPSSDEAWLMVNSLLCSNNASSNYLMEFMGEGDILAGAAYVTENMQYLGARNTYITAPFVLGTADQQFGTNPIPETEPNPRFNTEPDLFNQTTAEDLGTLLTMIYDCATQGGGLRIAYPEGEYTQTECQQMLELMSGNDLQRLLQGGLPPGTRISHKNGWLADVHGDAGIVFSPNGRDYVISVFVWQNTEFFDYQVAWPLIEEISRAAWNYFNPENPLLARRSDLPIAAQECVNFIPPSPEQVNLSDIDAWRTTLESGS